MEQSINKSFTLEQVRHQFEHWRQTRNKRCPIPKKLWQAAESLFPEYSLYHISKALRLNYTDLKKRIQEKPPPAFIPPPINPAEFIELKINSAIQPAECLVEMEDPFGAKMRMHFKGEAGLDLLELAKHFGANDHDPNHSTNALTFSGRTDGLERASTDWLKYADRFLKKIHFPDSFSVTNGPLPSKC